MATTTVVRPDGAAPPPDIEIRMKDPSPKLTKVDKLVKQVKEAEKAAAKAKKAQQLSEKKARATGRNWVRRAAGKGKFHTKKAWKAFRRWMRSLRRRARSAAAWTRKKVNALARLVKKQAKATGRWLRDHTRAAQAKVVAASKATWSRVRSTVTWARVNTVTAVIGAWDLTAPFRGWIATPFRMAFGTSAGLAALLAFGGRTIILLTLPWIGFLLFTGRMKMVKRGKTRKTRKTTKSVNARQAREINQARKATKKATMKLEASSKVLARERSKLEKDRAKLESLIPAEVDTFTPDQRKVLEEREFEIRSRAEDAAAKQNKNMASEYAGRLYLVQERAAGSVLKANQLVRNHRSAEEAKSVETGEPIPYIWAAVKRGIIAEDKVLAARLEQVVLEETSGKKDGVLSAIPGAPDPTPVSGE